MKSRFHSLLSAQTHRPQVLHSLHQRPISANKPKWNSKTNVIITNPTLLIMESCTNMLQLKQIQAQMTCTGLIHHTFPVSRVLAFCAIADGGDIHYANLIFTRIEKPNTYMWNTMIRGYSKAQVNTTGFSFFGRMVRERVEMDCRSFVFALKACGLLGDSVHCVIWKMGFGSDLLVRNGLVHYYAEAGSVSHARKVFDESPVRDVVTWTTMIDGYAGCGYSNEAVELFDEMLFSDVEPNEVTMIAVLSACSNKGDIGMGKSIHEYVRKKNVNCSLNLLNALLDMYVKCGCLTAAKEVFDDMKVRDVFTWTSMVNGYAKCGELDAARQFFNDMPDRNVVSWNAMIAGYAQNNQPTEAVKLFHDMVESGFAPIENSLVCVLSACGQLSCLDLGRWIHQYYVHGNHIQLGVILGNALIDMYAKCGCLTSATELFNEMPEKNLVSWNTMIAGYAAHGHAKQALSLFNQMKSTDTKPDNITFVAVLSACSHGGLVSEGREHFKSMIRDYGIEPKEENYACMIDLLGRIGLLEEAYELINKMPMEPSASAWGALLNSCKIHGNVELAKLSAEKLLDLDPEDSGIYVSLANLCAIKQRWVDVRNVRSLMKERGVQKNPGHSLIEVQGQFHEFFAADKSHPQSEEVYRVLNEMYMFSKSELYLQKQFDELLCI
ncbi:putative tetratricopeptide-like helical domain-containing protein [Rosa chinensis]|uniref:Putative tetratricopeptide-like helical domain-containing protein n=1 Tax=Rosa chinensis TaxID=74649 RepID=A0A2P6PWD1_ROSCH|nr:pentatricopeptide repeat-containing protein At2g22410, mitochondrial [Rosa chinensis]PRQ26235.1 putative tetratricopeptide-like helical domain-containing protein [Rosa chinensis]